MWDQMADSSSTWQNNDVLTALLEGTAGVAGTAEHTTAAMMHPHMYFCCQLPAACLNKGSNMAALAVSIHGCKQRQAPWFYPNTTSQPT
jgi:hypothetical protein